MARAITSGWAIRKSLPIVSGFALPLMMRWRKNPKVLKLCWSCCGRPVMKSRARKSRPCSAANSSFHPVQ